MKPASDEARREAHQAAVRPHRFAQFGSRAPIIVKADIELDPVSAACHCLAVRQAARQITQLYDHHLAPTGLRATQFAILRTLARRQPATMQTLAAAIIMDRTTLTRSLRPLEREGLIAVARGQDNRTRVLTLTPAGEARLEAAHAHWMTAQADFETRFGLADLPELRTGLAQIVSCMKDDAVNRQMMQG